MEIKVNELDADRKAYLESEKVKESSAVMEAAAAGAAQGDPGGGGGGGGGPGGAEQPAGADTQLVAAEVGEMQGE